MFPAGVTETGELHRPQPDRRAGALVAAADRRLVQPPAPDVDEHVAVRPQEPTTRPEAPQSLDCRRGQRNVAVTRLPFGIVSTPAESPRRTSTRMDVDVAPAQSHCLPQPPAGEEQDPEELGVLLVDATIELPALPSARPSATSQPLPAAS